MKKRIYLATKGNTTVGVNYTSHEDGQPTTAKRIKTVTVSSQEGGAMTRESSLNALVDVLEGLEVENITEPVPVYINKQLFDFISKGTYKYWIFSGAKSSGEVVDAQELELWKRFQVVYSEKNLHVCLRDIFKAKLYTNTKFTVTKEQKVDDYYSKHCWDEIANLVKAGEITEGFTPQVAE